VSAAPPPPAVAASAAAALAPQPFMLEGSRGALGAFYTPPHEGVAARGDVLVVPAFAEEMNRCRAMVSRQARLWAAQGVGTLVLDPFGTGDSDGEFVDATWAQWRDDLRRGIDWLDSHGGGCHALLGLRVGAVMAAELARACDGVQRLLLWQPVISGKTHLTQFLRVRIAAELNQTDRIKSTDELRRMFAVGQAVEVSGYEVGPALATELDATAFDAANWPARVEVDWLEVVPDGAPTLAPASQKVVETLRQAGAAVRAQAVSGPAFWHVHERVLAPALLDASALCARRWPPTGVVRHASAAAQRSHEPPATPVQPLWLPCAQEQLSACLHHTHTSAQRGVVIVVAGGPQYRAGAHRQFVSLARRLAGLGYPVLRFDLRGMGDSSGEYVGYEDSVPDIRAAVDRLLTLQPNVREVVLVGECESASGILFYAWTDPRVKGAVLINPWVRTVEGQAQVVLKTYYLDRLRSREFWRKLRSGDFDIVASLRSLGSVVRAYWRGRWMFARARLDHAAPDLAGMPLPVKTAAGLARFDGQVLLLMSGRDYIAREFDEVTAASRAWDGVLDRPNVRRHDVEGADHTFSKRAWKDSAGAAIAAWMAAW
jgi:exosortase A-associated hydrolase 1/exosortase A-associated hydrolase 2